MAMIVSFLRDRRGVAMIDYGVAVALLTLVGQVAGRHGMALSAVLRHAIGA